MIINQRRGPMTDQRFDAGVLRAAVLIGKASRADQLARTTMCARRKPSVANITKIPANGLGRDRKLRGKIVNLDPRLAADQVKNLFLAV